MALMGGFISAARQVGIAAGTPAHVAAMLPDEDCIAPCWQGIRTVLVRYEDAASKIMQLPQARQQDDFVWTYSPDGQHTIDVYFFDRLALTTDNVQFGDILAALGPPDYQTLQLGVRVTTGETEQLIRAFYQDEQVVVGLAMPLEGRLSANTRVVVVNYRSQYFAQPYYSYGWYGLIWLEGYPPILD